MWNNIVDNLVRFGATRAPEGALDATDLDDPLSGVWIREDRSVAHHNLPDRLYLRPMPRDAAPAAWRLLRVLLVWLGGLPI
jgi:hypothetical protein